MMSQFNSEIPEMIDPYAIPKVDRKIEEGLIYYRYKFIRSLVSEGLILDIGSGPGLGANWLNRQDGMVCFGIDHTEKAIVLASSRFPSIRFIRGDGNNLPYASSSFDAVTAMEVIEHVPKPRDFLWGVKRVLKFGGILAISTPNRVILGEPDNHPYHYRHYNVEELANDVLASGFEIVKLEGFYFQIPHMPTKLLSYLHNQDWSIKLLLGSVRRIPKIAKYLLLAARKIN